MVVKDRFCNTCRKPCSGKQCRECYEGGKNKGKVCKIYANRKRRRNKK